MEKSKTPNLVILAILTVITIVIWIAFGVIRAFTKPEPIDVSSQALEPLSPNLNTESLNNLNQRIFFSEGQIGETTLTTPTPSPTPTPTPEPEEEQVATQSAEQEEATESGETQ